ncbi:hypothetical protein HJG60_008230 [Phyllostomus discolor]|uniref:L1 transposable element RRM domain-containing protein n=1 Tax=Phyllostomus discolor TaxID=89673 RepID=A0A834DLZ1_9CHIR|nr:hypothetical protein HJG60_008230 [Phyllostomus discolor]
MEINNLSDTEFKTLVIRMLKEHSEDLSSTKKIQSEMKYSLTEIKKNLQGNKSRMDEAKNQINDLGHKEEKNNQSEQKEKRIQNNEDSISSHWDKFKRSNICLIRVPEGEVKVQKTGNLFEKIVKENIPNLVKEIDMQVQEARRVPNKMGCRGQLTPKHIIIEKTKVKDKENFLKASREKKLVIYRGVHIRLSAVFSKETL